MVKKYRKKRTMTPEQKAAAAERLAKAREKRLAANGGVQKNIHPSVRELDDDHPLSVKNVKEWIKYNRERLPALKSQIRSNEKRAVANYEQTKAYINNLENYLKNGVWLDMFYGPDQNFLMGWKTIKRAGD